MHRIRYRYDADLDGPIWEPLERLVHLTAERSDLTTLDVGDFMYMARYRARRRPDLHLYKHHDTRRYLNIDDAGHTYAYLDIGEPSPDLSAWYVPLADIATAIARLNLGWRHRANGAMGRPFDSWR